MKILICDPISPKGIERLKAQSELEVHVCDKPPEKEELISLIQDAVAVIVRSETKIPEEVMLAAPNLKVVGRAGVGVDNIDVESATKRGIVVMNTPSGNTISTAELTFSMLMASARKIPQANMSMKAGEWNRKAFKGTELYNKTLGIIGLGRIGSEVARRAVAFGMRILGYDPYLTLSRAKALQLELAELDEIYQRSDFITVHIPMTPETKGMLNKAAFSKMKRNVRLINCARGGIIDENDLVEAVEKGQVAGAALDVYEKEPLDSESPLRKSSQIIMTPHLGASTSEAQENVGIEVADIISDYVLNGVVASAVNIPSMDAKTYELVKPYLELGEKLGRLVSQLAPDRNDKLVITYGGRATEIPTDPVTRMVLTGFLRSVGGLEVNQVNVRALADSIGLVVEETQSNEKTNFNEWLHVAAYSGEEKISVGGALFGSAYQPRIVRLNGQPVEIVPEGFICLLTNADRPGIVGHIGTMLGNHGVNIASMSLNRDSEGGRALTVLNLDSAPPSDLILEMKADEHLSHIRIVNL
ncbi:MAG TPA: phosphoglycerate dehydrogenase [Verrucomicrobiales bacterium]|nr:phosphoglycerate dehydrogenase [Verrucomicrobiales bacterium]HIL69339.1 phosphoglycerate dehydrogenase [Verrucomicrobiota bacterium]